MVRHWLMAAWLMTAALAIAQTNQINKPTASPEPRGDTKLKAVVEPLAAATKEVDRLRTELKKTTSEEQKAEINSHIEAERERIRQMRDNFRNLVGGAAAAEYDAVTDNGKSTTIQQEFQDLVQPLLSELRSATSRPRDMEALRRTLAVWQTRHDKAALVVARIEATLSGEDDPRVVEELKAALKLWAGRKSDATGEVEVLVAQIAERERATPSVWETVSRMFITFWRKRGLNLLLALVVAVIGFISVRKLYQWLWRFGPLKRRDTHTLMARLADVLAVALAVATAVCGVLLVFYIRGDWLLLTVAAIVLFSAAWASKESIPPYFNQIRMILNLGAVREGERVIHNGIPWRVRSLGVFSSLTNPALEGGNLRLPVRDVLPMVSREADPKEPWFPTEVDDWVILADSTYGKVITQTPERVVVLRLGGSLKTYATSAFLAQCPENLSRGFRVSSTFGIDYGSQNEATGAIPDLFERALTTALLGEFGREGVRSVQVEFARAATSSLEYVAQVDCHGTLAFRYGQLERMIQRVCVDVCNERGWVIPFNQLTIHQASAHSSVSG